MGSRTSLYDEHLHAGAKIVDFGGWDMPLHYGSQLEEHHSVRKAAGIFDVSHMTIVDLTGDGSAEFLRRLLANNVDRLTQNGKALYSCMLNAQGGVIDDLICYFLAPNRYRLVVNAATREKDLAWINEQSKKYDVEVTERTGLAMVAIQGPKARSLAADLLDEKWREQALALKPFFGLEAGDWFVARTGYTGEDGWEIAMPRDAAATFWQQCLAAGIAPAGLGARDTLRLEAAMNLYGTDMDETVSPLEAGLGWTIAWKPEDRNFIGRRPLSDRQSNPEKQQFSGLLLRSKGVLRNHQRVVVDGHPDGEITSGGFSPTMQRSIAMARLPAGVFGVAKVEVRNRLLDVRIVDLPFVRNGQIRIEL